MARQQNRLRERLDRGNVAPAECNVHMQLYSSSYKLLTPESPVVLRRKLSWRLVNVGLTNASSLPCRCSEAILLTTTEFAWIFIPQFYSVTNECRLKLFVHALCECEIWREKGISLPPCWLVREHSKYCYFIPPRSGIPVKGSLHKNVVLKSINQLRAL